MLCKETAGIRRTAINVKYCVTCGREEETYFIDRMGTREECCIKCGMTLAVEKKPAAEPPKPKIETAPPPPPPEPPKPEPPKPEPPKPIRVFKTLDLVIVADDSPVISNIARESLINKGLAREVIVCIDGADFVSAVTSLIKNGVSPSLVILSISMPRLNGLEAGLVMRSMERGARIKTPVPLIFLTSRQSDEKLEQVILSMRPADHLYKGSEPNREQFEYMLENALKKMFPDNYEYILVK